MVQNFPVATEAGKVHERPVTCWARVRSLEIRAVDELLLDPLRTRLLVQKLPAPFLGRGSRGVVALAVLVVVGVVREGPAAVLAPVRFLARVQPFVNGQAVLSGELFSAHVARIALGIGPAHSRTTSRFPAHALSCN